VYEEKENKKWLNEIQTNISFQEEILKILTKYKSFTSVLLRIARMGSSVDPKLFTEASSNSVDKLCYLNFESCWSLFTLLTSNFQLITDENNKLTPVFNRIYHFLFSLDPSQASVNSFGGLLSHFLILKEKKSLFNILAADLVVTAFTKRF
jgi:hypothetical protein